MMLSVYYLSGRRRVNEELEERRSISIKPLRTLPDRCKKMFAQNYVEQILLCPSA
jgi:hypothetical protein